MWLCWGLLGVVGVLLIPAGQGLGVPGLPADELNRADALWYQSIGDSGYRSGDASAAFFPLYPLAIFLVSSLPGVSPLMAATVIAQGCYFESLVVLHVLTMREFDGDVAERATRYLAVFPTAFFLPGPRLTRDPGRPVLNADGMESTLTECYEDAMVTAHALYVYLVENPALHGRPAREVVVRHHG